MDITSKYDPKNTEEKWYKFWIDNKLNHSEPDNNKESFTIVIPPPNITGVLHMGHALNNVIQDILIRYNKMMGKNSCWIPGTDHGGIATQNVIEKQLRKDGSSRHDIGREKFLEIMDKWQGETRNNILNQLKKIGCMCDWDRTRFTLDDTCKNAVFNAFKTLYERGLIYKGNYMVNWCPRCHTAISDIEVEYTEQNGHLWYMLYPFKEKKNGEGIIVATTRPETMLGDTAVCVNPNDKRYKKLIGQKLKLPLTKREIPIIADPVVEKEFGTGAVKVTPAHDVNDYEIASRHNLEHIIVIDKSGNMTEASGSKYKGLDRYKCRKSVLEDLESLGFLKNTEKYKNNVSECYRCNTVIEPLVSEQWFLKTKDMAEIAIKSSKESKITFLPKSWEKSYLNWMENLKDWCISRQIWWGHRIPIWYCKNCHNIDNKIKKGIIVSIEKPKSCPDCASIDLYQDEDVLDTWFSSSLWPFSTLKWPESSKDLNYYYPTSVLVTGHEILYLWVARMIMMGLTLNNDIPFRHVYIHGIVRDSKGKKMSKSYGNVIDPLEVTSIYGTDALRFTLAINGIMGRDLNLSKEDFAFGRNFCNKLWNASRLILTNYSEFLDTKEKHILDIDTTKLDLADKWILSIFENSFIEVKKHYKNSDFAGVARILYDFVWSKYCDWYLEIVKSRLYGNDLESKKIAYNVLFYILINILKLLHPIIPFITEEIYSIMKNLNLVKKESLLLASIEKDTVKFHKSESIKEFNKVIDIITAIRNIRGEMNIPPKSELEIHLNLASVEFKLNDTLVNYTLKLSKSKKLIQDINLSKPEMSAYSTVGSYEIYIPLKDLIDIDREKARLQKDLIKIKESIKKFEVKLNNDNFIKRAPEVEVKRVKDNYDNLKTNLERIEKTLANLI